MQQKQRRKIIFRLLIASLMLFLAALVIFGIFTLNKHADVPFIGADRSLRAQLTEPGRVSKDMVGVVPGAFVPRDPRVENRSGKVVYIALRVEILTGTGERL
ncbi:MAG: hypothetical protein FWF10_00145 [Clostridiales bacterium]|nr:hypothetical protein [Clostridiales bacterium]